MKNSTKTGKYLLYVILFSFISVKSAGAYNLRQFSSKDGLSNSAILSMYQDRNGFLWLGSCDGLNMFDGSNFRVYKPTNDENSLSGNLIESIVEAGNDILWLQTNYGLDCFDNRKQSVQTFSEFAGSNKVLRTHNNDIYVVKESNYIHYYNPEIQNFEKIYVEGLIFEEVLELAIDTQDILWIFFKDGRYSNYSIKKHDCGIVLNPCDNFRHEEKIKWCFYQENAFYFVDESDGLFEYDMITKNKYYIKDMYKEVAKYGDISSIIKSNRDYFIGFRSSGLIRLEYIPENKTGYYLHEIDIKSGIFCLMKDRFQDIIWVGTDGQGVYMYFMGQYSIQSTLCSSIKHPVNNPVRSLFLDHQRTLWIGTKGDGIIRIRNYDIMRSSGSFSEQLNTSNSLLKDNSVYSFAPSSRNILWIGSERGLNYYSYKDGRVKDIRIETDGKPVNYVYSISEINDSVLWLATVGEGIIKAIVRGNSDDPVILSAKRFTVDESKRVSNYFFTSYKENDSIIWFGNRGKGVYRVNSVTNEIENFSFDQESKNKTINDVFAIHKTKDRYWFGTSFGLVGFLNDEKRFYNEIDGLTKGVIHGILEDDYNNLWLSTNQGIIKYNILHNTFQTYMRPNELEVTEFSDGAHFKDELTGTLFFGGINGFITILKNDFQQEDYFPPVQFNRLSLFGKEVNIFGFLKHGKEYGTLELNHKQNFFSISFTAIDYINGNDYTYSYRFQPVNDSWIENGKSDQIAFTNITPGKYMLEVKYRNNITGRESGVYSLSIYISPPWYKTTLAYLIYAVFVGGILFIIFHLSMRWYRFKKNTMIEKLNQQQREEVYESKLRFFTNITHELCTPLTLISGPCEKIISYSKSDGYIRKYANLIQYNSDKLNSLINELIEFRRLETGNKTLKISHISVSELALKVSESFNELAEAKGYHYQINIMENVFWNSDSNCLNKIVTNLISNAFKYTSDEGSITVDVYVRNERLYIEIANTGKGIREKDIPKIFDRYTVLDDFEDKSKRGLSSRNGLGLAICHNMVKLLEGEIHVNSIPDEVTVFTVILPWLESNSDKEGEIHIEYIPDINQASFSPELQQAMPDYDKNKKTIMIVDDDPSMLWFITEIFREKYNVIPVADSGEVMAQIKHKTPDLIIADVMMPGTDGFTLTKTIKTDKLINHIPLILLSARNDTEGKVSGMEAGAEIYITKPFNVEYLEKVVARLIQRNMELKEYYNSVYSAYEMDNSRMLHKEDKEFLEKFLQQVEKHIEDPDLSVEMLSSLLGCSVRQLYRKLKSITSTTPSDMIREYRLNLVERLLATTNLSVNEILYKAGFVNKGNFFKIFSEKYGMTPKQYREKKKSELEDIN